MICSVLKMISTEIKKINERYPHFYVVITGDYMSRPIVIDTFFFFFGRGLILEGVFYFKRQPKNGV